MFRCDRSFLEGGSENRLFLQPYCHYTFDLYTILSLLSPEKSERTERVPLTSLIPIDLVIIDFNLHATLQKIVVFRVIDFKGDRCPA